MPIQVLIGTGKPGKIGVLQLDATLAENHSFKAEITSFPVENGADITDHIRNAPIEITVEGMVTNSPIRVFAGEPNNFSDQPFGNRVTLALEELLRIREERELVELVTGLQVYENMGMRSLDIPRSASQGQVLQFSAVFREVALVGVETVTVNNAAPAVADKAASTSDDGKKTAKESTEEENTKVSIIKSGGRLLKKAFTG